MRRPTTATRSGCITLRSTAVPGWPSILPPSEHATATSTSRAVRRNTPTRRAITCSSCTTRTAREVARNPYALTCGDLARQPQRPESQRLVIRGGVCARARARPKKAGRGDDAESRRPERVLGTDRDLQGTGTVVQAGAARRRGGSAAQVPCAAAAGELVAARALVERRRSKETAPMTAATVAVRRRSHVVAALSRRAARRRVKA
jgi:hypothetical protein